MDREGRKLYVSTGTMVGKSNGYDYRRALGEISVLREKGLCDGLELMMLRFYYDKIDALCHAVKQSGNSPALIHCEKDVGSLLSRAAQQQKSGEREQAMVLWNEAKELFSLNCTVGEKLRIPRMALHLWGGIESDGYIEYNVEKWETLQRIAGEHGLRLLCENVPSNRKDPLYNWHRLLPCLGDGGLVFDTRFAKLHEQIGQILTDEAIIPYVEHVHISDFAGSYREFTALRPILHPGEGSVDFEEVARLLEKIDYRGSVTLESPVMQGEELDIPKIENTLSYLRRCFG